MKRSVAELWTRYSAALRRNRKSVGVQLGLSTAVWGFKSGKVIDDCEYPQVKDSNRCPEGDLPTRDTHLRHLAAGLAGVTPRP